MWITYLAFLALPIIFIVTTAIYGIRWLCSGCGCCFRTEKYQKYQNQIFPKDSEGGLDE